MAADYRKMRAEVNRVLHDNRISAPPISPRELAETYGLDVREVLFNPENQGIAGFIDFDERRIYLNAEEAYSRKTFTIAHELGHFLMHRSLFEEHPDQYKVLMRRPIRAEHDPIEKEANAFAAHLLVPRHILDRFRGASISDLADLFAVSTEVIRNRLDFEYAPTNSNRS